MAKFRKKPVVVEAFQWNGFFEPESAPGWFLNELENSNKMELGEGTLEVWSKLTGGADLVIRTLEGKMTASVGDYIIKGVQGEIYPCKPDIFEQTYEAVE